METTDNVLMLNVAPLKLMNVTNYALTAHLIMAIAHVLPIVLGDSVEGDTWTRHILKKSTKDNRHSAPLFLCRVNVSHTCSTP